MSGGGDVQRKAYLRDASVAMVRQKNHTHALLGGRCAEELMLFSCFLPHLKLALETRSHGLLGKPSFQIQRSLSRYGTNTVRYSEPPPIPKCDALHTQCYKVFYASHPSFFAIGSSLPLHEDPDTTRIVHTEPRSSTRPHPPNQTDPTTPNAIPVIPAATAQIAEYAAAPVASTPSIVTNV